MQQLTLEILIHLMIWKKTMVKRNSLHHNYRRYRPDPLCLGSVHTRGVKRGASKEMGCSSTCLRRKIVRENNRTLGYSCLPPPQLRGSGVSLPGSPERSPRLKFPTPTGTHSKVSNKPHGNQLYMETAWSTNRRASLKQHLSLEEAPREALSS